MLMSEEFSSSPVRLELVTSLGKSAFESEEAIGLL